MGRFIKRNAIFFLFPVVVVAIAFLARINFSTAELFGKWGAQSIVESTFLIAKEKVTRVEETISKTDHMFFRLINPSQIEMACKLWKKEIKITNLIEAAAIVDEEGYIVEFFHYQDNDKTTAVSRAFVQDEIIPLLDMYESLYQHKHLHRQIEEEYKLVTSFTSEFEDHYYTAVLVYNTKEITNHLFKTLLGEVGKDRLLNVSDHRGNIIFGDNLRNAREFIVIKRFPSTLYKWSVQLAPKSAALYLNKAKNAEVSQWLLISLAFAVIVLGLVVLYMAMVRERRLNRLKSEFIANASHELKTPLALIKMFTELLATKRVHDEKKLYYHNVILRETDRLTALIDNVLDYAKIERGKSVYEFRKANIADIVEPALEIYRHRVEDIGATLEYKTPKKLPYVLADADAIVLILLNLIDNAVKYAKGTKIIGVELFEQSKYIYLDVFDHGLGIPPNHLKRIFERFYRYEASNLETQGQRGTGIGLSLVKHVSKAHGGNVTVSSAPGIETRFSVRIPILK